MSKKCAECGKWLKNMRGFNVHYNRMHGQKQELLNINIPQISEILDRVRKLELDNNFMKHQLKHKTFVSGNSKDADLDWDLKPEIKAVKNEFELKFNIIVKELKVIFTGDNFDYHNVLKPINPIEEIVIPPIMVQIQ